MSYLFLTNARLILQSETFTPDYGSCMTETPVREIPSKPLRENISSQVKIKMKITSHFQFQKISIAMVT